MVKTPLLGCIAVALAGCVTPPTPPGPLYPPVIRADFPDPFLLEYAGGYLAYATNTDNANVQMASSADLATWRLLFDDAAAGKLHDALPVLPAWATAGDTWAPEVIQISGTYVLYFTARHTASGLQCVGAATSADPRGPFTPQGSQPLVCQTALGGTIDASPFREIGRAHV